MSTAAYALPAQLTMAVAMAAHAGMQEALRAAQGQPVFTVDAATLQEFDTSALAVLLEASRVCQAQGARLLVSHAPHKLGQLAALYGVDDLLGLSRT